MKKHILVLTLLVLAGSINSFGQNSWTKKASFGAEKRTRAVAFSIGDYGYVGCGEDTAEVTHNDLWRYDPIADVWSQMMTLPGPTRRNAVGVTIGDKGYIGLGMDSSISILGTVLDDWWEYSPLSNSWLQKADYPGGIDENGSFGTGGVYFATAFAIETKGYVCGGKMDSDFYGTDLWEYDQSSDAWTRLADFPGGDRYQLSSFSLEGHGYVGMGIDHDLFRKDWWKFDPITGSWTQTTSLPGSERASSSSFVLGQRGYIVFGSDGGYKDELWEYNPFSSSWNIKANFPANGRKNGIAFAIGDKGYAGTGSGASGKKQSFYEYSPLYPIGFDDNELSRMSVFPNPLSSASTILFENIESGCSIRILDFTGKEVFNENIEETSHQLSRDQFESGTYLIVILDESNHIKTTEKLIVI